IISPFISIEPDLGGWTPFLSRRKAVCSVELPNPPHHEYTDKLLASVPEMDPNWLDNLLNERASTFL
ncbi:MAG: hypothetical protein R6U68_14220, partial [Desulfobacteraceae bacterium]